jgi:hypothetical protein
LKIRKRKGAQTDKILERENYQAEFLQGLTYYRG